MTKSIIRSKIALLKDFLIIKGNDKPRIEATKKMLADCTEHEAERLFRDLIMGTTTLDNILTKRGFI